MFKVLLSVGFALCLAGAAFGADVGGVKLADKAAVGGQELVLNGAGIRTKVFFKVYVGSLYVPAKAADLGAVLAKGPRRIQMNLLRDLSADQLVDALNDGLKDNNTAAELAAVKAQQDQLTTDHEGVRRGEGGQRRHARFRRRRHGGGLQRRREGDHSRRAVQQGADEDLARRQADPARPQEGDAGRLITLPWQDPVARAYARRAHASSKSAARRPAPRLGGH